MKITIEGMETNTETLCDMRNKLSELFHADLQFSLKGDRIIFTDN